MPIVDPEPSPDMSQACPPDMAAVTVERRREQWLADNKEAMDAWNDYVARHGLPLAGYR